MGGGSVDTTRVATYSLPNFSALNSLPTQMVLPESELSAARAVTLDPREGRRQKVGAQDVCLIV